jgi:hypothetical protein
LSFLEFSRLFRTFLEFSGLFWAYLDFSGLFWTFLDFSELFSVFFCIFLDFSFPKSVTKNVCHTFGVNKSLSMMWRSCKEGCFRLLVVVDGRHGCAAAGVFVESSSPLLLLVDCPPSPC